MVLLSKVGFSVCVFGDRTKDGGVDMLVCVCVC